jgi:hypothetical protein
MIATPRDIDKKVETFTAADETIPMRDEKVNGLPIPPMVLTMIHPSYLRRKYQRTGYKAYGTGLQLLNRVINSHMRRYRNET